LQVASAKAVQVHWYQYPLQDAATEALNTPQLFLPQRNPADIHWQHWLLKSQGEGGGNVVEGSRIPERLASLSAAERKDWLLMRKIDTVPRPELVPVLRRGLIQMAQSLVSELGVFICGRDVHPAGYLLRSKPMHAVETGVHRGEGVIDTLALAD
jgi:glutathione synthase